MKRLVGPALGRASCDSSKGQLQEAEHEKEGITGDDLALNKDIGWFNERFVSK